MPKGPQRRPAVDEGHVAGRGGFGRSTPAGGGGPTTGRVRPRLGGRDSRPLAGRETLATGKVNPPAGGGLACGHRRTSDSACVPASSEARLIQPRFGRTELRPAANSRASRSSPPASGVNRLRRSRDGSDISPPVACAELRPRRCSAGTRCWPSSRPPSRSVRSSTRPSGGPR